MLFSQTPFQGLHPSIYQTHHNLSSSNHSIPQSLTHPTSNGLVIPQDLHRSLIACRKDLKPITSHRPTPEKPSTTKLPIGASSRPRIHLIAPRIPSSKTTSSPCGDKASIILRGVQLGKSGENHQYNLARARLQPFPTSSLYFPNNYWPFISSDTGEF